MQFELVCKAPAPSSTSLAVLGPTLEKLEFGAYKQRHLLFASEVKNRQLLFGSASTLGGGVVKGLRFGILGFGVWG